MRLLLSGLLLILVVGCGPRAFRAAQQKDTIEAWRQYLRENPKDENAEAARVRLAELELEAAKQVHTPLAYKRFLDEFPDTPQARAARALLEGLRFNAAMERSTVAALRQFLADHPDGAHAADARKRIQELELAQVSRTDDPRTLEGLARDYPEDPRGAEARVRLDAETFERARAQGPAALLAYLNDFPAGAFREQARAQLLSYRLEGLLFSDLLEEARAEAKRSPLSAQLPDLEQRLQAAEARRALMRSREQQVQAAIPEHYLRSIEDLERALGAPDPLHRWEAALELGYHASVRAIDPLLDALRNARNARLRHQAFTSLQRLVATLPPRVAEYELASRIEAHRGTSVSPETALLLAVLLDLSGRLDAAAAEYQKAWSPENPEPTVLRRWIDVRLQRRQWFSAAVAARQLALWAEQTLKNEDVSRGEVLPVSVARQICAAAEAARVSVETLALARGQKTDFPEDLLQFELQAKQAQRLGEAMLKDAELRLRTQDKHATLCRDSQLDQRLAAAEEARVGALKALFEQRHRAARPLLELAAGRDPSEQVRSFAKDALARLSM